MKFSLVFDSNDFIPFEVVENHELFEFFVEKANKEKHNSFSDNQQVYNNCNRLLNEINWSLGKTNEVLFLLYGKNFPQCDNVVDYFDQSFLNKQHEQWVFSQKHVVDIDKLRWSDNVDQSRIGYMLHDVYPDHIRKIKLAEAMIKLGYIFPYEEVNLTVHRLESFFNNDVEFKADEKWQVFDNPFVNNMISDNRRVNFSFGYTYVGRQYYNKWQYFDSHLECRDHYNYETLEWAFQVNLGRPETIAYSPEFLAWCQAKNVNPISTQIPIANVVDLEKNLHHYRTVLYKNSRSNCRARISF